MRIFYVLIVIVFSTQTLSAQKVLTGKTNDKNTNDKNESGKGFEVGFTEQDSAKIYNPTIYDYQFWKEAAVKKPFDTALTLENQYRYTQFNNQDNFGKMAFNNVGQTFNQLLYVEKKPMIRLMPYGKSHLVQEIEDIRYYDVKSPSTEFIYHNGIKEGQILSTLYTHNINSQINYSLQYKGLRSYGRYLESEVNSKDFIVTSNYHTKNKRYQLQAHYYNHNNGTEENAGLLDVENFTSGNSRFKNRQRLLTNLADVQTKYLYRRYFIGQEFAILNKAKDSLNTAKPLTLQNDFSYETINYRYNENSTNDYYLTETDYIEGVSQTNTFNRIYTNKTSVKFNLKDKYKLQAGLKWQNINYFTEDATITDFTLFPSEMKDNRIGFFGNLSTNFNEKILFKADAEFMTGDFFKTTYFVNAKAEFNPNEIISVEGKVNYSSQTPALNLIYNTSIYQGFNYYLADFKNENTTHFQGKLHSQKYKTSIFADAFTIDNFTYVNASGISHQAENTTSMVQIGFENDFSYHKFHLNTKAVFQKVTANDAILPLPNVVARLNLYYKTLMFKDFAHVQTGIKAYYFSSFKSGEFFPINNEFRLQEAGSETEIGNYPVLDLYFNMKVKRMQIYLEAQHFNSNFTGYNYFSAPNIPYSDFRLNIGLVWYIFT